LRNEKKNNNIQHLPEFQGSNGDFCHVWKELWREKMSQPHMWDPTALHTVLVSVLHPLPWQGSVHMPKGIVDIQKLIVVPEQHSSELLNALVSAISPLLKMTCFMIVGKRHPH
jgi:hypothetical protein